MLELVAVTNAAIALAFFVVAGLIFAGLLRDRALGISPLGIATAFMMITCATGHALHAEHYLVGSEIYGADPGLWHQLVADGFTFAAAAAYLAQRQRYGLLIRGPHALLDYQRRAHVAEALRDIGQDITAQTNLEALLQHVVHHARALLDADYAAIVTLDAGGRPHRQVVGNSTRGWDEEAWNVAVFLESGGNGSTVASRRPVALNDLLAGTPQERHRHLIHTAEGGRSVLAVPICRGNMVSGSLMVSYRSLRCLTQDDLASAAALAGQAAIAIENTRLIESLRQADHLKDEFLSAAAHELKTPVTTIKGWTEMLLRSDGRRPEDQKALEALHSQSQRISRLSEDLLAVVRLKPGLHSLKRERFDLSELSRDTVEHAERRNGRRTFHLAESDPVLVEANRPLIMETLGRLIENAVRYSPTEEAVEVGVRRVGKEAMVSVTDHGIGIPLERQPHVFEPFYEPVPSGAQGYVGIVSLGLHLSRQVIRAHGGRIWFTSTPGEGSTFSFSLPLA